MQFFALLLLYQNRSSDSVVGVLTRLEGGLLGGLILDRDLGFISFPQHSDWL